MTLTRADSARPPAGIPTSEEERMFRRPPHLAWGWFRREGLYDGPRCSRASNDAAEILASQRWQLRTNRQDRLGADFDPEVERPVV